MPALQNLVLTDRAGTPVNHTFTPMSRTAGVAVVAKSSGVPIGNWTLSIGTRRSASRRRITLKLAIPVTATETINGVSAPKVVRTSYANVEFNFDVASTTQERDDIVGMLRSALADTAVLVDKTVVDLEDVY